MLTAHRSPLTAHRSPLLILGLLQLGCRDSIQSNKGGVIEGYTCPEVTCEVTHVASMSSVCFPDELAIEAVGLDCSPVPTGLRCETVGHPNLPTGPNCDTAVVSTVTSVGPMNEGAVLQRCADQKHACLLDGWNPTELASSLLGQDVAAAASCAVTWSTVVVCDTPEDPPTPIYSGADALYDTSEFSFNDTGPPTYNEDNINAIAIDYEPDFIMLLDHRQSYLTLTTSSTSISIQLHGLLLVSVAPNGFITGGLYGEKFSFGGEDYDDVRASFDGPIGVTVSSGTFTVPSANLQDVWWNAVEVSTTDYVGAYMGPSEDADGTLDTVNDVWTLEFTETVMAGTVTLEMGGSLLAY